MAQRLARIAKVSLEDLGKDIFSAGSGDGKTVEAMLGTDYKEFHIAGHNFAVSQITCMDSASLLERKEEFLQAMRDNLYKGLDIAVLMITDVLMEGSHMIFVGDEDTFCQAFNVKNTENCVFLPKIMSRKKQVIPTLSALWG
jgi:manganese-dependent inorganic pyrophosphatase